MADTFSLHGEKGSPAPYSGRMGPRRWGIRRENLPPDPAGRKGLNRTSPGTPPLGDSRPIRLARA